MSKKKKPVKAKARKTKRKPVVVVASKPKLNKEQRQRQIAASLGNNWWERRSKHGRDKIFSDPQVLMQELISYLTWINDNPEKKAELVKYEGSAVEEEVSVKRLATIKGFCLQLGVASSYFRNFKAQIRARQAEGKSTELDKEFSTVIEICEDAIENYQVSGAASNFFNGNIISRLVGLVDKHDIKSDDEPIKAPVFNIYTSGPPLAGSEDEVKD